MLISDPYPEFRSSINSGTPREWYRNMRPAGLLAIEGGSDKSGILKIFLENPTAQLKIVQFY